MRRPGEPVEVRSAAVPAVVTQAVRVALEGHLATRGWQSLHASAVLLEGRAVLFAAPSGTGKSTLARWCDAAGCHRISDEATLVRATPTGFDVTPHPSQLVGARFGEAFPLHLVCELVRGAPGFERLRGSEAAGVMLRSLFCHEEGVEAAQVGLSFSAAFASRVPVLRLRVPNDATAVEWVRAAFLAVRGAP